MNKGPMTSDEFVMDGKRWRMVFTNPNYSLYLQLRSAVTSIRVAIRYILTKGKPCNPTAVDQQQKGILERCEILPTIPFDVSGHLCLSRNPDRTYHLFGLTFWSGGHYRGAVLVNGVWHHYDGLWERNTRGQAGLCKNAQGNHAPHKASSFHTVFIDRNGCKQNTLRAEVCAVRCKVSKVEEGVQRVWPFDPPIICSSAGVSNVPGQNSLESYETCLEGERSYLCLLNTATGAGLDEHSLENGEVSFISLSNSEIEKQAVQLNSEIASWPKYTPGVSSCSARRPSAPTASENKKGPTPKNKFGKDHTHGCRFNHHAEKAFRDEMV
ncbi:hypothetical protein ACROYT_G015104 [Oculina patagonica]